MKFAILSNSFSEYQNREVEEDLTETGKSVAEALESFGHEAKFFDVNEKTFEKLRKSDIDMAFNVCERFRGNSFFEPHVASMLELLGIPYTGSGPLALALCMNKARVKEILLQNEIPTPGFQVFYSRSKKLSEELKFPLIVKPVCMDNSVGIDSNSVVYNEDALRRMVGYILRVYDQPALVEEFIEGREFAIGVLGNTSPSVLPISEFIFSSKSKNPILSYNAKWNKESDEFKNSIEICPAQVPKYIESRMRKTALDVYSLLEVRDYGRIDIRLSKDNIPYVLEMNPNPGISADNTIPKAAKSLGLEYNEMIMEIVAKALERYKDIKPEIKSKLDEIKEDVKKPEISPDDIILEGPLAGNH